MKYTQEFLDFLVDSVTSVEDNILSERDLSLAKDEAKDELFRNWNLSREGHEEFIGENIVILWETLKEYKALAEEDPEKAKTVMVDVSMWPETFFGLLSAATYGIHALAEDIIEDFENEKRFKESLGEKD